ncbi:MAG: hypothetical protein Kow0090_22450 [Myxococcota bacterium]
MTGDLVQQLLKLGREYYQTGEYGKAESYLTQVLKHSRVFADVHNMLGVIYYQQGNYQRAKARFEEALRINPRYVDAAINLSVTYNELGEFEKASEVYKQAVLASQPTSRGDIDPYVKGKIANMYADIGDAWLTQGELERAKDEFQKALDLCPGYQDIRTKLALCLRDTGDLDKAEALLKVVIAERPNYLKARIELGLLYFSQNRKEEASKQWEEVLKLDYSNKSARMYMRLLITEKQDDSQK